MPVVPKKVGTPYTYYIKTNAKVCMEKNKISMTEASSLLSKQWNEMSDKLKQPYLDLSFKDQTRHQKQVADFKNLGYFTLEDGTKSSSIKPKIKKVLQKRVRVSSKVAAEELGGDSGSEIEVEAVKPMKKRVKKN